MQNTQRLLSHETQLVSCQDHYSQMEASISQRLRWAAGANPSLNAVLTNFENAISYRKKFIEVRRLPSLNVVIYLTC